MFRFAGDDWELIDPWFLLLAPLAWLVWAWRLRRRRAALPAASFALFEGLPTTLRARCAPWLVPTALALGATALGLALARPVTRDVVPVRSEGVDILLALDQSSSMDRTDMEEGARRVDVARACALAFAEARETDRVGLLTFARFADLRCPPTLDMEALAAFLRAVDTVPERSEENATAIGVAVAEAAEHFSDEATTRVLVLLTDGEETVGYVTPAEGAKLAADAGVRIHTIGIGMGQLEPFTGMVIEPDFGDLETIADTTGGRFFRARTAADLAEVYAEIDRMEKRVIEDPRYRTTDWFATPLLVGLALVLLGFLLELFWLRGAP